MFKELKPKQKPKVGNMTAKTKFVWFPRFMNDKEGKRFIVWLEMITDYYEYVETYTYLEYGGAVSELRWKYKFSILNRK